MQSYFWNKYLPVIRILLKKALAGEQVLQLDVTDFEKAGMMRKAGYKFVLKIKKGKIDNVLVNAPLASSLASLLLHEPGMKELLADREYHITLNQKFQLSIKNIPILENVNNG